MPRVIRQNDPTDHGGKVVGANANCLVMGIPVARVGDACTCPQQGHQGCVIAEGDPNFVVGGRAAGRSPSKGIRPVAAQR